MLGYALGLIETKGLIGAIEATDAAAKAAAVVISSAELTDAAFMTVKIEGELGAVQAAVEAGAQAAAKIGELVAAHVIARPSDHLEAITPDRRYVSKYHDEDQRRALQYGDPTDLGLPRNVTTPLAKALTPESSARPTATAAAPVMHTPERAHPVARPQTPPVERTSTPATPKPERPIEPPKREARTVVPPVAAPASPVSKAEATPTRAELEAMPVVALRQFARNLANLPIQGRQISMANRQQLLDAIASILPLK